MAQLAIPIAINLGVALFTSVALSLLTPAQKVEGQRLNDLTAPKSTYGQQIPRSWGTVRMGGNVIWARDIEEVQSVTRSGGKGGPKSVATTYEYFGSYAALLCRGPIVAVRKLWLNSRLVVDLSPSASDSTVEASLKFLNDYVRVYLGNETQLPDPLIQTDLGADSTPAYRGRAYLVFDRLPLTDYGNAFPAVSAEVLTAGVKDGDRWVAQSVPLSQVVTDICTEVGYSPSDLDVTELENIDVRGFWVNTSSPAAENLQALRQLYFFDVAETALGKLRFVKAQRGEDPVSVPLSAMGVHPYGNTRPERYRQRRSQETNLPSRVTVVFPDPHVQYREGQQLSPVRVTQSLNETSISALAVLSASEAKTIADINLFLAWVGRRRYDFALGMQAYLLEPSDLLDLPFFGNETAAIARLTMGANLQFEIEAVAYAGHLYDHRARVKQPYAYEFTAEPGNSSTIIPSPILEWVELRSEGTVYQEGPDYTINLESGQIAIVNGGAITEATPVTANFYAEESDLGSSFGLEGPTDLRILDAPLLSDRDSDYGVYAVATGGAFWRRASLFVKAENETDYTFARELLRAEVGQTVTALPVADALTIDEGSVLRVSVPNGSLESVTLMQLVGGANTALVGNEVIRFRTATLVSSDTWDLTGLVRGVRGTQNRIAGHSIGERFILLRNAGNVEGSVQDVGAQIEFKALTSGQALEEVTAIVVTPVPERLRPYPPNILSVEGTGTVTVTWARCDRRAAAYPLFAIVPLSEAMEKYRVELRRSGSVVSSQVRTVQNATVTGVLSGDVIRVMQVSQFVGDGGYDEVTV